MFDMMEYHKMLRENKITLIYSGPLWAEGIGGVAGTVKKRLEFDKLPLEASQEVFSVFVEQMNNMLMYSQETEQFTAPDELHSEAPKGTFIMGTQGKGYFIQTGNVMKTEAVNRVKTRIDHLNTLDKDEVNNYYWEQSLLDNHDPESKGAGLGLIEIARRISSKIEYTFRQYDEHHTFFTMYVLIGGQE
ncbi:MAG: SiaB family protein kinase [Oscillospiraceae bacterium]|nr:SiaB family protein kinase [Oscillospiraceae bacterium]